MKRFFIVFFLGLGFLVLQSSLLPMILPWGLKPDAVVILVTYLGLNETLGRGAVTAYLLGLLQDVFAGQVLGLYGLALLVTFVAVRLLARRFNTESSLLLLFMVGCCTLMEGGMLIFSLLLFADSASTGWLILRDLPVQLISNLVVAVLLLIMVSALQRRLGPGGKIPGFERLDHRYES